MVHDGPQLLTLTGGKRSLLWTGFLETGCPAEEENWLLVTSAHPCHPTATHLPLQRRRTGRRNGSPWPSTARKTVTLGQRCEHTFSQGCANTRSIRWRHAVTMHSKLAGFIDKDSSRVENGFMRSLTTAKPLCVMVFTAGAALMLNAIAAATASAASPVYWCPDRKADQQYSATQGPGCIPLVEKKEAQTVEQEGEPVTSEKAPRDFKIENLQRDVSAFLHEYRQFLSCCKTDPDELQRIADLGEEVSELLESAQKQLSNYSMASRGIMLRDMITPVTTARADLRTLRNRLGKISDASNRREQVEFEESGRETRTMRDLEESIDRDIRAPKLPGSAKTGMDIGGAPAAGPNIGKAPRTGTQTESGRTGQDIGASPKSSTDIGASGPTGFAIGATGRAGPSIGESTLNNDTSSSVNSSLQRSTIGSNISDSSIGSSLGSSNVGSSLQDSSVGSSLGGSSVGSSLQNR